MNLAAARLAPSPGADGLVSRIDGAILFVASRTPASEVARLVEAVDAAGDDPAPGRQLARAMATLVGSDSGALPGFALVAASAGGIYVKAYGAVEVRVQGEGGEELISAVGSFTGLDRELTGTFHTVVAHRAGEPVPVPAFDLDVRAGTSPGGGFALTTLTGPTDAPAPEVPAPSPAAAPEPEPASAEPPPAAASADPPTLAWTAEEAAAASRPADPPPAAPPTGPPGTEEPATAPPAAITPEPGTAPAAEASAPPADLPAFSPPGQGPPPAEPPPYEAATMPPTAVPEFTSHLLGALDRDEVEERAPLPVELDPGEVRAPDQDAQEVIVGGVLCSRGHFNDPRSRFCSSCGISMVQNTQVLTPGPRPPLGVLVFEDGATFSLAQDYVVGRQPEASEAVQQGLALPLPVDDPERSISRAHAELRLVDWDVHLINLSATNGSFVWDEHQQQWVPIPTGQSVMLSAGMRVALGRRSAVFESSLVR